MTYTADTRKALEKTLGIIHPPSYAEVGQYYYQHGYDSTAVPTLSALELAANDLTSELGIDNLHCRATSYDIDGTENATNPKSLPFLIWFCELGYTETDTYDDEF